MPDRNQNDRIAHRASRRAFLIGASVASAGAVFAACSPTFGALRSGTGEASFD